MLKDTIIFVFSVGLVLVLAVAAMVLVPSLQSPGDAAWREAGPDLEKARRLMSTFGENEERLGNMIRELAALGAPEVALEEATISHLIDQRRDDLAGVDETIREWFKPRETAMRKAEEQYNKAISESEPSPRLKAVSPVGPNMAELQKAIAEGRKARDQLIQENSKILADAEQAIQQAIGALGNEGNSTSVLAHRLKGMVLYHQGLAAHRQSVDIRRQIEPQRTRLVTLAAEASGSLAKTELLKKSAVDEKIAKAQGDVKKLTGETDQVKKQLTVVAAETADLEKRLSEARADSDRARATMDQLEERGLDLTDSGGASRFAQAYREAAKSFQEAEASAQALEFGTLANAQIDDSRDLVGGQYVPVGAGKEVTFQRGLVTAKADHKALEDRVKSKAEQVESLRTDIARLESLRSELSIAAESGAKLSAESAAEARSLWDQMVAAAGRVHEAEEQALKKFSAAKSAFDASAQASTQWVNDANSALQTVDDPEAKKRSPKDRIKDSRERAAFAKSQSGDALLSQGLVYLDRMRNAEHDGMLLASLRQVPVLSQLGEDQLAGFTATVSDATEAGKKVLESAVNQWKSNGGALGNHWTVAAQVATAMDALARFGDKAMATLAMQNYQAAVAGREEQPYSRAFVERIQQLQRIP